VLGIAVILQPAAFSQHVAQTEIGEALAFMQAGEYRRALALASHVAGGHPDAPGGAALYAQLLELGGLGQVAARVVPPPGIVSTGALRSGWGVGAGRHRGPPYPTTTATPWPWRGRWPLTSRQTPTLPPFRPAHRLVDEKCLRTLRD